MLRGGGCCRGGWIAPPCSLPGMCFECKTEVTPRQVGIWCDCKSTLFPKTELYRDVTIGKRTNYIMNAPLQTQWERSPFWKRNTIWALWWNLRPITSFRYEMKPCVTYLTQSFKAIAYKLFLICSITDGMPAWMTHEATHPPQWKHEIIRN